ncbi:MAG: BON domain-containing protein [Terriglobales bacterium]|jgi:hypothetical protein
MKSNLRILFCVLIGGALAFGQMGQPGGTGGMQRPGGQLGKNMPGDDPNAPPPVPKVDDATLDRQVHEQLTKHPELAGVSATVKDGVVQLTGTVAKKEDKKEARKVVNSVKGVLDVKDKLTISSGAPATAPAGNPPASKPM